MRGEIGGLPVETAAADGICFTSINIRCSIRHIKESVLAFYLTRYFL
jgi:hypothetical protein